MKKKCRTCIHWTRKNPDDETAPEGTCGIEKWDGPLWLEGTENGESKHYELEKVYGTAVAALMIYQTSDPDYRETPDFYAINEAALDDMKRLAEAEAA